MLPIATVKLSPNEFIGQASDEAWFKLAMLAEKQQMNSVTQRIRTALLEDTDGRTQRRITFPGHEISILLTMIENG